VGNITSITDARGYTNQYEYDLLNRLKKKINPDLTEREAVYDDVNNTVTIYDELDHYTVKHFDGLGRVVGVEYNGVYTEEYTYNYLNKVETRTDPLRLVYTYEYDSLGRITESHHPDGIYSQWVYNNSENTVTILDENSHSTEYHYDWAGNLLSVKELNHTYVTEYAYDERGNVIQMTDSKGNTTPYEYGLFGLICITYPDLTTENVVYDSIGNVIQKTTGAKTIYYHYNSASQLIETEYPDSSVVYAYDANGNRISMVDTASSVLYVYDSRNRLLSETKTIDNEEYTTLYSYDSASNVISLTYPDGTVINRSYDSLNRITSVEGFADFSWNGNSQIEEITYTNGITTNYTYDLRGRPAQITTTRNGSDLLTLNYQYDPVGNILQVTNSPNTLVTEQWDYTYDALNRLLTAVGGPQGDSHSLNYSYDSTGNRIQLNDTVYTYNNTNELLAINSEGSSSSPWWDSNYIYRREITFGTSHDVIPEGYTCTFLMDTTVALPSGDDIRIVYQTDTQMTELDRIGDVWYSLNTSISFKVQSDIPENAERGTGTYYVYYGNEQASQPPADPQNVYVFYDSFNRPDSNFVGNSWIEDEQFAFAIIKIVDEQLRITEHQNEYAHVEQSISEDNVEVTCRIKPDAYAGYGWAPSLDIFWNNENNGNHVQIMTTHDGTLGCKIVADGTADAQWVTGVVSLNQYNWVRIRLTPDTIYFDYGGTGDEPVWVNKRTESRPPQMSGSFSKIILGKGVEQVPYTNSDLDNNYTTPGEIGMQYIDDITIQKYIVNPPEITLQEEETEGWEGEPETGYTFSYDEYGNCVSKSDGVNTWEYQYDYENRLVSVKENGQVIEQYTYDGDGQRIKKVNSESVRIYINSGVNVLYEINMTTQMDAVYIYGPTGRIAKKINDLTEFYHTDHLGSTRITTSETGAVITEIQYKPFGEQISAADERYTYNGKELDDSGLYYYGARYYDSEIGRFLTRDPLRGKKEAPQTMNRYVYCLNNPLKYIDPAGTDPQDTVEEIFDRLLDIDSEEYAEVQELIDAKDYLGALVKILELMGYHIDSVDPDSNSLKVIVENTLLITIKVDNDLEDYGDFDVLTQTASINFAKSGIAADIALTIAHEISHAVLCDTTDIDTKDQEPIIYGVQYAYMNVLWSSGVGYSRDYMKHVGRNNKYYDKNRIHQVPISKIMEKWLRAQGWEQHQV